MANKSGVAEQVLSLPKGGGALQGIGETFSPDLHTGTGNFSVPLALPPGRNGFGPTLTLGYSTGSPNGPFGLGWSLSVPGVSRKTSKGLPTYKDNDDTFILSGAEDLVPVPGGTEGATRYRPRTEGLFARIEHHQGVQGDYWEVRSKDGLCSVYGTPRPTNAPDDWLDPAVVSDPDERGHIFAWRLTRTTDPFGNQIVYTYQRDTTRTDGPHHWDLVYLKEIRYVDYGDPANPQYLVSVRFEYEERPDPFSDYRPGFEVRTVHRCARIQVVTQPGTPVPVRTYHLRYEDRRDPATRQLQGNGVSLLSQLCVEGHDGTTSDWLPPLEFGYTQFEPERRRYQPLSAPGGQLPERSLGNRDYELVDLFADGLPSVLQMNGTVRFWRNLGNGRFDPPRMMHEAPAGLQLDSPGVQIADMNGDGRADLLVTDGQRAGYYSLDGNGGWDRRGFVRYRQAPSVNLQDPEVRLVDLDGDGVVDALRTSLTFELFFNDPQTGWDRVPTVRPRGAPEDFPDVSFSDPRVKLGCMTGDGLQDIVLISNGRVDYWPYRGQGRWGRRITMHNAPRFEDAAVYGTVGYDPRRVLLGDVDGDGCADLVYVGFHHVTVWLNQSGNGWSEPITIAGTPSISDYDAVRLADMNGTGTAGILWTYDLGAQRDSTYKFLDLTGGTKPYLLNRMDNGCGAVTLVEYGSSTEFFVEDERSPKTCWQTSLPFPVQVVKRTEVVDAISHGKLTTEYRYHHGYWDGTDREFRGFGLVEHLDTERFADYNACGLHGTRTPFNKVPEGEQFAPPTLTKTWFHQGPVGDARGNWRVLALQEEFWPSDPPLVAQSQALDELLRKLPPSVRRQAVRALRGTILRTQVYALDDSHRQDCPYSVAESRLGLYVVVPDSGDARLVERPDDLPGSPTLDEQAAWVFFPVVRAQRTTQWERGDDPLSQLTFTDDHGAFGQARQQTSIALPRRQLRRQPVTGVVVGTLGGDVVDETRILATHVRTEYATPDAGLYLHDRVAQTYTVELSPEHPRVVVESDANDLARVLADQLAAAEAVCEVFRTLPAPRDAGMAGLPDDVRLIGHTLNHYDGDAFTGRDVGAVGPYGAMTRTEALAFTAQQLDAAYGDCRPTALGGPAAPPADAPVGFGGALGYRLQAPSSAGYQAGYYADTQRRKLDVHGAAQRRGVVVALQDPLGHQTDITPDKYWLLPEWVTDARKLPTHMEYDYRVLQAQQVTDPNGSATSFVYTGLGLLERQFVRGNAGEGGTQDKPEVQFDYDFQAFARSRNTDRPQPIRVHTTRRVWHAADGVSDEVIEAREYSDGFGRVVQRRAQAEDLVFGDTGDDIGLTAELGSGSAPARGQRASDRVVVSGWQVYDNKGRVVEKYEPFFGRGWDYQPETEAKRGQHATLIYDARGRLVRTVNPDGSEQRVILGVPADLRQPGDFAPTPWEQYTYDPNDLAPLSFDPAVQLADGTPKPLGDRAPDTHHFTPSSSVVDALGRTICQVVRNGADSARDWHVTRSSYDTRGNLLGLRDALGRPAFQHAYDLLNRELRVESVDAGVRTWVLDAAGNLAEARDSKGACVLREYDALGRLKRLWARDAAPDPADQMTPVTLRERLEYGDEGNRPTNRAAYRLGRLVRHHDEAGVLECEQYDFMGNLTEKTRRVVPDAVLSRGWTAKWSPEGDPAEDDLFDAGSAYRTGMHYDALGRVVELRCPADAQGHAAVLTPEYNRAGALEKVGLDGEPFVTQIAYNARGQRVLAAFGNRVLARYVYDPRAFRLLRLRSERCQDPAPPDDTWTATGSPLQDLGYSYDLVGNVTCIEDRTPGSGVTSGPDGRDALRRRFQYDPLYRLLQASGRACTGTGASRSIDDVLGCGAYVDPFNSGGRVPNQNSAPDQAELYAESYEYDPSGNLLSLRYSAPSGTWTREFGFGGRRPEQWASAPNNQLTSLQEGAAPARYQYDANGNLCRQNTERKYTWDHADRLIGFRVQPEGSTSASVDARYLYAADGLRVKKWLRTSRAGNGESTTYIDGFFEDHRWQQTGDPAPQQSAAVHVLDGQRRIAVVRRGPARRDDAGPPIQYHLSDHLGSSSVVVDDRAAWINREEYFPYGETSFGSFAQKRYRFAGKERDEKSGLYYHGARYYVPWIGRWLSPDPSGPVDSPNLYTAFKNNPISKTDIDGRQASNIAISSVQPRADQAAEPGDIALSKAPDFEAHRPGPIPDTAIGPELPTPPNLTTPIAPGEATVAEEVAPLLARAESLLVRAPAALESLLIAVLSLRTDAGPGWQAPSATPATPASAPGAPGSRTAILPGTAGSERAPISEPTQTWHPPMKAPAGTPSTPFELERARGGAGRAFMQQALKHIIGELRKDPKYVLGFLVEVNRDARGNPDWNTAHWASRSHLSEEPSVQAGHLQSFFSGAAERFALEDAFYNQLTNWTGERLGVIFDKPAVLIGGLPVELNTAVMWQNASRLPAGTVNNAPRSAGWTWR